MEGLIEKYQRDMEKHEKRERKLQAYKEKGIDPDDADLTEEEEESEQKLDS